MMQSSSRRGLACNFVFVASLVIGLLGTGQQIALGVGDGIDDKVGEPSSSDSGTSEKASAISVAAPKPQPSTPFIGVAVLDTGVSLRLPVSPLNVMPSAVSLVGGNPLADASSQPHGTAVAQTILTLSPGSKILSVQTSTGGRSVSSSAVAQGMTHAVADPSVRVINHSNAALAAIPGTTIMSAALAGKVLVMSAGNDRSPNPVGDAVHAPNLAGRALIVGGLGPDGQMLGFSNRAGSFASHYVVAVGASEFAGYWGTSFATPRVSALAARILQTWPKLKAEQVVEIIKRSATDMGEPGVDSKFGWGQINFARAFQPLGPVKTPLEESNIKAGDKTGQTEDSSTTADTTNSGGGFDTRRLKVGGAVDHLIRTNPYFSKIQVVDQYGRNFRMDLAARSVRRDSVTSVDSLFSRLAGHATESITDDAGGFQLTTRYRLPDGFTLWKDHAEDADGSDPDEVGLSVHGISRGGQLFAFGLNSRPEDHWLPVTWESRDQFAQFFGSEAFRAPWMGYTEQGLHSKLGYVSSEGWHTGLAFSSVDDGIRHGSRSDSGALYFGQQGSNWAVKGRVGLLLEDGNLQGGSADGALSVESSETVSGNLAAWLALDTDWTLLGSYTEGATSVADRGNSLLANFSTLHSNTWAVGLIRRNIMRQQDTVGFSVAQPMRTRSGSVSVNLPYSDDYDGVLRYYRKRVSLVPSGRENALEFFYRTSVGRGSVLTGYLAHRLQPDHMAGSTSQSSLVLALQGSF